LLTETPKPPESARQKQTHAKLVKSARNPPEIGSPPEIFLACQTTFKSARIFQIWRRKPLSGHAVVVVVKVVVGDGGLSRLGRKKCAEALRASKAEGSRRRSLSPADYSLDYWVAVAGKREADERIDWFDVGLAWLRALALCLALAVCTHSSRVSSVLKVGGGPCTPCFERRNFCIGHACHDES
jgi:hypothetical protein